MYFYYYFKTIFRSHHLAKPSHCIIRSSFLEEKTANNCYQYYITMLVSSNNDGWPILLDICILCILLLFCGKSVLVAWYRQDKKSFNC